MKWKEIQISTKNRAFYTLVIWHKLIFFPNESIYNRHHSLHWLSITCSSAPWKVILTVPPEIFYVLNLLFFMVEVSAYVLNLEKKMGSKQTLVSKIRAKGAFKESCSWNNQVLLYFHVRKRYMSCIRWLLAQATFSEPFLRPTEPSRQEESWGR